RDAGQPLALLSGQPIYSSDIEPMLAEAAGAQVLEEYVLEHVLESELRARAIVLEDGAVERERNVLVDTIVKNAAVPTGQTPAVIERVRQTRGLGDARFTGLLRRNAMLRRLVRDQVSVTADDVRLAHQIRYGVRYRTRLILTNTEAEAADALARING